MSKTDWKMIGEKAGWLKDRDMDNFTDTDTDTDTDTETETETEPDKLPSPFPPSPKPKPWQIPDTDPITVPSVWPGPKNKK